MIPSLFTPPPKVNKTSKNSAQSLTAHSLKQPPIFIKIGQNVDTFSNNSVSLSLSLFAHFFLQNRKGPPKPNTSADFTISDFGRGTLLSYLPPPTPSLFLCESFTPQIYRKSHAPQKWSREREKPHFPITSPNVGEEKRERALIFGVCPSGGIF